MFVQLWRVKNNIKKPSTFGILSDNRSEPINYFFASPARKEVLIKKTRKKTTRKEARKRLKELKLAVTLSKVINHFFPGLLPALARVNDPRNASYITYSGKVILMTRIRFFQKFLLFHNIYYLIFLLCAFNIHCIYLLYSLDFYQLAGQ